MSTKRSVKVFKYGLRRPVSRQDATALEEQARAAHRYRNTLIEIERGRRAAMRSVELSDPVTAGIAAALSWLQADVKSASAAIKASRSETRSRSETKAMRQRLKQAKALVKRAAIGFRMSKAASRERLQLERDRVNELAGQLRRSARAHRGELYWGTYLLHEAAVDASSKAPLWSRNGPNDPHFIPWNNEASWSVQIQGGMSTKEIMGCQDTRVRIERVPAPAHMYGRRATHRAVLHIRIGSNGRDPIWARCPMIMHRPLPEDAIIKRVTVHRRMDGRFDRWSVDLTIETAPAKTPSTAKGRVAIDIGWRQLDDGSIRVAYWADEEGNHGALTLTQRDVSTYHETLRSVRDRHVNLLRSWLCERRQQSADLPPWFLDATAHTHQWQAPWRFMRLCDMARANRDTPGDVRLALEWWRYRDIHLWDWEVHQRGKTYRRRTDTFRRWARKMANRYAHLVIEDFDLRSVAQRSDDDSNQTARSNRQTVGVSRFRMNLVEAFASTTRVEPSYTTVTCSSCGHQDEWDPALSLTHQCSHCDMVWDQDHNAAINLLAREKANSSRRSVTKSKPGKWDRVAELRLKKEGRQEASTFA